MALAVASTSVASTDLSSALSVTAPTGILTGDLLLIVASQNTATCPGFSVSAQTSSAVRFLYKIAVLADESTGSYSVSQSNSGVSVVMMRITGWVAGDPINVISTGAAQSLVTSSGQSGLSLNRPTQQLLIMGVFGDDNDGDLPATSAYSITSGDANPSFTEAVDARFDGVDDRCFSLAYATSSNTSTITAYSMNVNNDILSVTPFLAILLSPQNASGTNALLAVSPVTFNNTAVEVGTAGTNDPFRVSPEMFAQSGRGDVRTPWTNSTKESTTWTNDPK